MNINEILAAAAQLSAVERQHLLDALQNRAAVSEAEKDAALWQRLQQRGVLKHLPRGLTQALPARDFQPVTLTGTPFSTFIIEERG